MAKIPFHFTLFYGAMVLEAGRVPDRECCEGADGMYEFIYEPQDPEEAKHFERRVALRIAKLLDLFDIIFSGSRCEFGSRNDPSYPKDNVLYIKVAHPVPA